MLKITKGLLISSIIFLLTACGGGGGGTPTGITINNPTNPNTIIGNNIVSNIGLIDNALQTLTSVNGISATAVNKSNFVSMKSGFVAMNDLKTTWDGLSTADKTALGNISVTVDLAGCGDASTGCTKTMYLDEVIEFGYQMYTRYYEPYQTFWNDGATTGYVDETSSEFAGIKAKVEADEIKTKNQLISTIKENGDATVTDTNYTIVNYTETSEIVIGTSLTKTVTISEETVTYDEDTISDYWPTDFDPTTAAGCSCARTYTNTTTATQTYDSFREDTISYARTDTVYTYSDGTVTTIPGQPAVTNTVTGTTQERNITFSNHQTASTLQSTSGGDGDDDTDTGNPGDGDPGDGDDSDDGDSGNGDDGNDYTDSDTNLGTKTTGIPTNANDFLTGETRAYCPSWQGCTLNQLTVWTTDDLANGTGTSYQHIEAAGINDAWARGWTGKGVNVGIIDTGVNVNHDELDGQIGGVYNNSSTDWDGHGSHVAGTIVAKRDGQGTVGVAFDSKLYVVRSPGLNYLDSNYWNFFKTNDVDVINLSINGRWDNNITFNNNYVVGSDPNNELDTYHSLSLIDADKNLYKWNKTLFKNGSYTNLDQVIAQDDDGNFVYGGMSSIEALKENMANSELILVNSAGNYQHLAMSPGWYATATNDDGSLMLDGRLIIVGSYDPSSGTNQGYSATAGSICWDVVNDVCQDEYLVSDFFIRAPEGNTSLDNAGSNYTDMSGTSMAAPVVTGSIALLRQMWPHMTGSNTVKLVLTTADSSYDGYNVGLDGHGRLDMNAATLPVGAIGIPTDGRTDGNTISSNGYVAGNNNLPNSLSSLIVEIDNASFNREWLIPLANAYVPVDTAFHSFTNYAGLQTFGTSDFAVHLKDNNTDSLAVTVDGTTFGYMKEDGQYLGKYFNGMFAIGETQTAFLQKGNTWNIGSSSKLSANVNLGYTTVDTVSNSLINQSDDLMSYGWSVQNNTALNNNWNVTSFLSQPVTVFSGNMNINAPTSRDGNTVSYTDTEWSQSSKVETDLGVGVGYNKNNFSWTLNGVQRFDTAVGDDFSVNTSIKWMF